MTHSCHVCFAFAGTNAAFVWLPDVHTFVEFLSAIYIDVSMPRRTSHVHYHDQLNFSVH
jgi:hypothetical protein